MALERLFFEVSLVFRTILFILAYGIALILSIPFTIYRQMLTVVAKIWRPDLVKILPIVNNLMAQDNFFEDKVVRNIVAWQVMEGCLSMDTLRKVFMENVINFRKANGELEFPEFRQYMVPFGGYVFWKNVENFDIKNHIRSLELDTNVTEFTESDLRRVLNHLTTARWTKNRGLWEIIVLNNYTSTRSSGDSVMIFRFHHSLADGYSYLHCAVRRLCRADNMVVAVPSRETGSKVLRFLRGLVTPLKLPYDYMRFLAKRNNDRNEWLVGQEQLLRQCKTVWSDQVELQVIKGLKRKFGVSFYAVLVSVIGGAIRRLMEREGQDVPEIMTAITPFPKKHHPEGLRLNFYLSFVKVPVKESDPEKRLELTQSLLREEATSTARFMIDKIFNLMGGLPHALLAKAFDSKYTIILSLFPGIGGDIFLGGHKVYEVNFTFGTAYRGVAFTTLSCFNALRFNITIDEGMYPSENIADVFRGFIREEIQSLLDAPGSLESRKERAPVS